MSMVRQCRSVLFNHTSRAYTAAAVARYSTIHTFFSRQQNTPRIGAVPQRQYTRLHLRIFGASRLTDVRLCVRQFSWTSCRRVEDSSKGFGYDNYPPFFRRLALSLPTHRPTREDFLNAANGFWQRARVRFRWLTIRSFRKYNADDISAFVTWFVMSQTLWLFIGTTTFFSVIFATINSLRLQEYVARAISDYLTSETGITIIFESAIVPKWKDSRISFKNVYVIRGPKGPEMARARSDAMFHAGHKVAVGYDVSNHPSFHSIGEEEDDDGPNAPHDEDLNYTMFDLTVDSIDVTLSFARWWQGKGLVVDAVVKGVRGVLDRRNVFWDPDHPLDPVLFRHESQPGDFELESLQIEDLLLTVYQPGGFRPFTASIFRADMRTFRKQWPFYDFLAAENVVGQYDNCLFSLHRPQSIGRTTEQDLQDGKWARMSRFRMDGLNVDHMQAMTTQDGPFSWITSGKVDAVLDIKFPRGPTDELQINALLGELADAISTAASSVAASAERIPGQSRLAKPPLSAPSDRDSTQLAETAGEPQVVIDIDLRFRDLKAAVPIFTNELSYTNNALVRPIVAFMNANRTLIPIHCRVVKPLSDFEGSWTLWETGLMDIISLKVYEAMAYHVTQANFNRRLKVVSAWSLQMTASAVISALKTLVDPAAMHLRELYEQGAYDTMFRPLHGPLTA
ncbi:hypothetical protein FOMPIDRAFT_1034722 [Fomitopsis schrenkii]|uniref:Mitochondrial distribution and morphology protein family 31/32 n=1 Tax=Fomitopsis schrenkii TaxID=2126942 RepID=S8EMI4_FOMSC|nr:hypothetical protein FOMPIDRAFT_1034722 [Fomitopsis schrenkii]